MNGFNLFLSDCLVILRWVIALGVFGLCAMPVCFGVFRQFKTKGYVFSKIIGLTIGGYLIWFLSSLGLVRFTVFNTYLWLFLIIAAEVLLSIVFASKKEYEKTYYLKLFLTKLKEIKTAVIITELSVLSLIMAFNWLFGHRIQAESTERIMDFGIMKMIDTATYLPPLDMWSVDGPLNYYYFGQYLITYLSRVAHVRIEYGYTLGMCTIAAMAVTMIWTLVYELLIRNSSRRVAVIGGSVASVFVTLTGNLHYVFFYLFTEKLHLNLSIPNEKDSYWFADSTRYIGYNPLVEEDRTIHEFPWYSFLIGDLHAHVVDILIVVAILAVLMAFAFNFQRKYIVRKNEIIRELLNQELIIIAFLIGISSMTNYWDYPIYYVVSGSIVLIFNLFRYPKIRQGLIATLIQGAWMLAFVNLINLPFRLKFIKMESGLGLVTKRTPFYQFMMLWGCSVIILLIFILFIIITVRKQRVKFENMREDVYILLIMLCGVGLALLPEFIFVKDIYINGFPRANTMFKLAYEAYILCGLASGYVIARVYGAQTKAYKGERKKSLITYRILLIPVMFMLLLSVGYLFTSCRQWYGEMSGSSYLGMDSMYRVKAGLGAEAIAYQWVDNNVEEDAIVLQANGESYSYADTLSVITGRRTVLGWETHEWLWHNSYDYIYALGEDIRMIYTSHDVNEIRPRLEKYNVDYIYIGESEYKKYEDINVDDFLEIGEVVYDYVIPDSGRRNVIIKVRR